MPFLPTNQQRQEGHPAFKKLENQQHQSTVE